MKKIILFMAVVLLGTSVFSQNTGMLLERYISVKNALISDDGKAAGSAISQLQAGLKSEGEFAQKADLLKATAKLSQAGTDLEKQRTAFNEVSAVMWKLVKKAEKLSYPVYYQYCPMKKANWLSKEKEVKNPYYGAAMLTCGKVLETKS